MNKILSTTLLLIIFTAGCSHTDNEIIQNENNNRADMNLLGDVESITEYTYRSNYGKITENKHVKIQTSTRKVTKFENQILTQMEIYR